jgi:hypothetical protein
MSGKQRWILVGTAILGLIAAALVVVARYHEIRKANAEAEKAMIEAEQARKSRTPTTTPPNQTLQTGTPQAAFPAARAQAGQGRLTTEKKPKAPGSVET